MRTRPSRSPLWLLAAPVLGGGKLPENLVPLTKALTENGWAELGRLPLVPDRWPLPIKLGGD
jgi:hypothetical protein